MVRPGLDRDRRAVHPICQAYFDGYVREVGSPPGRNKMALAVGLHGIARDKARRDWRVLVGRTRTGDDDERV